MRCFICDVVIDAPQFNADHDDYDPCETCKQVIADTVGPFMETPFAPGGPFDGAYSFDIPEDLGFVHFELPEETE